MSIPKIAGEFRVVGDPELKYSQSGTAMLRLTLVANSRKFNKNTNEWEDDKSLWLFGTVFGTMAENGAESLRDKMLVVIEGLPYTNEYENRDGQKVRSTNINIDSIGPSLRWNVAEVRESAERTTAPAPAAAPAPNPWATGGDPPY